MGELLERFSMVRVELNFFFEFFCSSRACSHLAAVFMLLLDFNDRDAGTLLVR